MIRVEKNGKASESAVRLGVWNTLQKSVDVVEEHPKSLYFIVKPRNIHDEEQVLNVLLRLGFNARVTPA